MYPYKFRRQHGLTEKQKLGRRQKCKLLLTRDASGDYLTTLFTDEKIFTIERYFNIQNDCVLAPRLQAADLGGRSKSCIAHPQSVMVFVGITADGRTDLFFVPLKAKVNTALYAEEILESSVKPWAESFFGNKKWTFQQNGAPAHTSKKSQEWCRANFPDFIPKDEWPANSPDLNPMD